MVPAEDDSDDMSEDEEEDPPALEDRVGEETGEGEETREGEETGGGEETGEGEEEETEGRDGAGGEAGEEEPLLWEEDGQGQGFSEPEGEPPLPDIQEIPDSPMEFETEEFTAEDKKLPYIPPSQPSPETKRQLWDELESPKSSKNDFDQIVPDDDDFGDGSKTETPNPDVDDLKTKLRKLRKQKSALNPGFVLNNFWGCAFCVLPMTHQFCIFCSFNG